jgi:hypothetical protein
MTTSSSSMVNNSVSDTSLAPCSGGRGIAGTGTAAAVDSGEYSSPAECSGGLRGETRGGEMSPMSLTSLMPGEKLERKLSFCEKLGIQCLSKIAPKNNCTRMTPDFAGWKYFFAN